LQYLEGNVDKKSGDEKAGNLAVNLGTGRGYSVMEVIQAVEKATGRPVRRKIGPRRPGDPPALIADPSKAQSLLGWTAKRNLDDIVSSAWSWMQSSASNTNT
jgi:UDP-glucose 4-epimerase